MMKKTLDSVKRRLIVALGSTALVMFGVGVALGLIELLFRTNPNLVPAGVRVSPPVRRTEVFSDRRYNVKLSDGDLFYWMDGKIAPLPPEQDKVVAEVHFTTDKDGFRTSLPEKESYPVVALGDSFTVAGNVATPWPQKLAECTGLDVLNLGVAGIGPQEEMDLLREHGLNKRPQWIIMAFFEGNDLYDAAAYEQATPFIVARFGKYILTQGMEAWTPGGKVPAQSTVSDYLYPVTVTINKSDVEMAFFSGYLAWAVARDELIESSQNFRLVRETLLEVHELSEAADADLLVVYVPTKEHIYMPYLNNAGMLAHIYSDVPALELNEAGFIQFGNQPVTPELTEQHLADQAQLLAEFSSQEEIAFLDLTAYFEAEAAKGVELYYPFDTHWNQKGHDLAAQTIGSYLENLLPLPANNNQCRNQE